MYRKPTLLTVSLDHFLCLTFVSLFFLAVKCCYSNLLCDVILHFSLLTLCECVRHSLWHNNPSQWPEVCDARSFSNLVVHVWDERKHYLRFSSRVGRSHSLISVGISRLHSEPAVRQSPGNHLWAQLVMIYTIHIYIFLRKLSLCWVEFLLTLAAKLC